MRAARVVDLAARELQEGEAGLRVVAVLVCLVEGLGGPVEVAHPQADLADHRTGRSRSPSRSPKRWSSSQAWRASCSAADHWPWSIFSSARWTRQMPG